MIIALSCVSSHGLWILSDPQASRILAQAEWTDSDSTGLSVGMAKHFDELLKQASLVPAAITALFGVTGPGSFTGLRMSSSFLQGLAQGISSGPLPVRSVPTYDLAGSEVWIPLRHQKARHLDLAEARAAGIEFMRISGPDEHDLGTPPTGALCWGLKDHPFWPNADQLLAGVRRNLTAEPGLKVIYGLEPKISGKRT